MTIEKEINKSNSKLRLVLQNQLDALESNQINFILYAPGSGGEFLSVLISKYSKNNYFKLTTVKDNHNRFIVETNFLCRYFQNANRKKYTSDKLTVDNILSKQINQIQDFLLNNHQLKFDSDLNNGISCILPSHIINLNYMNANNTFYIKPDNSYWLRYLRSLAIIKVSSHNRRAKKILLHVIDKHFHESDTEFATSILMSQMMKSGYLEKIFYIDDDNFHRELINWHKKNIKLIKKHEVIL